MQETKEGTVFIYGIAMMKGRKQPSKQNQANKKSPMWITRPQSTKKASTQASKTQHSLYLWMKERNKQKLDSKLGRKQPMNN